jgi:hypothetical protein
VIEVELLSVAPVTAFLVERRCVFVIETLTIGRDEDEPKARTVTSVD